MKTILLFFSIAFLASAQIKTYPAGGSSNTSSALGSGSSIFRLFPTALATPADPTVTNISTPGSTTYGYAIVARNALGQTLAGATGTTTTGNAVLDSTHKNHVVWTAVPGAASYDVYLSTGGGNTPTAGFLANTKATFYNHVGLDGDGSATPVANTTAGTLSPGSATYNSFPGTVALPALKAITGTRYLCIDTAGNITSSTTACSGT